MAQKWLARLFVPVAALTAMWTVAAVGLLLGGASFVTVHTVVKLALSPLWFLLVFAVLTAATPLLVRLNPLWPLAVVLHVDLVRFGLGGPSWLGWVNVVAGWLVPYTVGAAWTRGELERPRAGRLLLVGGAVATALLVGWAGYPASMVGVPGAAVSNLNPPTLAAVTFGLAQCGLALLLRDRLRRAVQPAPGLGGGRAGQPLGDDGVPLAPDGHDGDHRDGPVRGPPARPAHGPRRAGVGGGPAAVAAGLRPGAGGVLGRVPRL